MGVVKVCRRWLCVGGRMKDERRVLKTGMKGTAREERATDSKRDKDWWWTSLILSLTASSIARGLAHSHTHRSVSCDRQLAGAGWMKLSGCCWSAARCRNSSWRLGLTLRCIWRWVLVLLNMCFCLCDGGFKIKSQFSSLNYYVAHLTVKQACHEDEWQHEGGGHRGD